MEPAWTKRKKELPPDIASIISASRVNNCWIFYEKRKLFFTPDEFEKIWSDHYDQGKRSSNFKDFKIVNPLYAIRLAARWVNAANKLQQEIINKMANYTADFKTKKA